MTMRRMTSDQKDIFIQVAQVGMACGLTHPWEWFANAMRMDFLPFAQRPDIEERVLQAFVAFWCGCGSGPGDPCENATVEDLIKEVNRYYAQAGKDATS
jgi:hypothetical protein